MIFNIIYLYPAHCAKLDSDLPLAVLDPLLARKNAHFLTPKRPTG